MTPQTQVRAPRRESTEFVKGINLTSATSLVIGSMIGSGIFIVSADIARLVESPALLILAWAVTGFMTIVGALAYGELAAMMPKAGGQYVFLRESLGPLWGFLYGWSMFLVIQTGTIAAVGVAFGKFLGVLFPVVSADKWLWHIGHVPKWVVGPLVLGNMDVGLNRQNLCAIAVIIFLTGINVLGVRTGALVQNIFTFSKTAALLGIVLIGAVLGRNADAIAQNFGRFWQNASFHTLHPVQVGIGGPTAFVGLFTILAVAQVGSLFSADAWNNVTFTAAEVENPRRNLPLSLALGTSIVILLYIAANFVYLMVLPLHGDPHAITILSRGIQYAADDRVGTAVMQQAFGASGAALMAIAILISTFGCNNGLILAGARIYYAMAKDGLFFRATGKLHPKYKTPAVSLVVQTIWTCFLCLSGTYGQLLDLTMFAVIIFYILTIGGLFVLRRTQPEIPRPYRAFGYPVLPAIYIVMAVFIEIVLLRYKPQYTWPGLIIVLLGIPVYLFWSRSGRIQGSISELQNQAG
ncbi:MAG TPA: amino acid permease [Terriglobales bacterium]|nr:amino acid permease [Terriglobales bacterium]